MRNEAAMGERSGQLGPRPLRPAAKSRPLPQAASTIFFVGVISLGLASGARAQDASAPDPRLVQPERPTVATHARTVAPGYIELEVGVQGQSPESEVTEFDTPSLLKLGVTGHLQFDVFEGFSALLTNGADSYGIGDLGVGFKWRLLDRSPGLGDFAVQTGIKFPTGSAEKGTGTGTTDVGLLAISSQAFGPVSVDVNVGYRFRSGDGSVAPRQSSLWTVSSGLPVRGRLGWAAEIYGYPGTKGASGKAPIVAFLAGPTLALRRSVALDFGGIVTLAGSQPDVLYAGLVWNIGRLPGIGAP